jgi:hypothetical protein
MKSTFSRVSAYLLTAMLVIGMLIAAIPVKAVTPTTIQLINPDDGSHNWHYTSTQKGYGDNIQINVTVFDVTNLFSWQVKVTWDPSLLQYVSTVWPTDHVFSQTEGFFKIGPAVNATGGYVVVGSAVSDPTYDTFNGTGRLVVITLKIIQGVSQGGPVSVHCALAFAGLPPQSPSDTFLLDRSGGDIAFTVTNGDYQLTWVAPTTRPSFYITPSTEKPANNGSSFALDINVRDVDAGWEIVAFQFSIMWNTTFIAPDAPYWTNGSFLEGFEYSAYGVIYGADINTHYRPPPQTPIPADYNYSVIGVILLPDSATNYTYHSPFPHGGGKLATLYFKAIYATYVPKEDWTYIEFINEDVFSLNKYGNDVGYNLTEPCHYRAPMISLGLSIDVYTQYDNPFGGQGPNQVSDSFGPQQQVELYARVLYNEYPVQQKLVGFEVVHFGAHQGFIVYREGTTNADGIAHVSVRLPWPCLDPVGDIFGWWYVNATVEVAEQTKVDNLKFFVWWPVEVVSIVPKGTGNFVQRKTGGDDMEFTVTYQRYDQQEVPVLVTVSLYDELGFFIGSAYKVDTIGNADYSMVDLNSTTWPTPTIKTWDVSIPMPTNAVVGVGKAYADAFNTWPWLGGTPYCPEVNCDFIITKGP